MPFISIIIPTHNNEEHIEQAILSCFDSDFDDFEVIIINDASTDGTSQIIKKQRTVFKNKIKYLNSSKQKGLGETRNKGLQEVSGEYMMFLDGDDWYEPKAIDKIANQLRNSTPDILMFNHQKTWDAGKSIPNIPNKYVNLKTNKDISSPNLRVEAIRNIHSACNKAYRTSFINNLNIKFPSGYYEDLYWSILSLVNAKTVYYINAVIFNYRQRKNSITNSLSQNHFDIFKQFELIFDELICSTPSPYLYELALYAERQITGILKSGVRIEKHKEEAFKKELNNFLVKSNKHLRLPYE